MRIFTPGRTEIIGNHADRQPGRVIAAAVRRGITAEVDITTDGAVLINSCGYGNIIVDITDLLRGEERMRAAAPLPEQYPEPYRAAMECTFGDGSCRVVM